MQYGTHGDSITAIDPTKKYAVRQCTQHPVNEHHRVRVFESLLGNDYQTQDAAPGSEGDVGEDVCRSAGRSMQLELLGELMYQSHASYSTIGLGSDATDLIVKVCLLLGWDASHKGRERSGRVLLGGIG